MPLFRRKKEAVPAELEPFYEKEPTWRIWLRRIVAVLVLILLIAAIIWAAVTVYRQVTNQDVAVENNGPETSENQPEGLPEDSENEQGSNNDQTTNDDQADEQNGTTGGSTDEQSGGTGSTGTGDNNDDTTSGSDTTGGVQQEGTTGDLPSTGPADVAVFVLVATVLGAAGYQVKLRKN